mgnify:CR=1 FL=1
MNLLQVRDRIRDKAITSGLTYTEIETLRDINELQNQQMPCLLWNYTGENADINDVVQTFDLDFYVIGTYFDDILIETNDYERDFVVTEKHKLREVFKTFISSLGIETANDFLIVQSVTTIPITERLGTDNLNVLYFRVTAQVKKDYCLNVED